MNHCRGKERKRREKRVPQKIPTKRKKKGKGKEKARTGRCNKKEGKRKKKSSDLELISFFFFSFLLIFVCVSIFSFFSIFFEWFFFEWFFFNFFPLQTDKIIMNRWWRKKKQKEVSIKYKKTPFRSPLTNFFPPFYWVWTGSSFFFFFWQTFLCVRFLKILFLCEE